MTKKDKISRARHEAERFMARCEELIDRYENDPEFRAMLEVGVGYKETAAVKRASMDLSRALAEVRKP